MYTEKTKNGKIRYVETYKNDKGEYKTVSKTFDKDTRQNQKIAYNLLQEKIKEKLQAQDTSNIKLFTALDEYMEYKKTILKPSSIKRLRSLKNFYIEKCSNWYLKDIKASNIYAIFPQNEKNTKGKTDFIKDFFRWCYKREYVEDIQFLDKIDIKQTNIKEKKEKLYLEHEEIDDILNFFKEDELMYDIIVFLLNTGLRIGELIALTFDDIQDDKLTINKTVYNNILINSAKTKTSNRTIVVNQTVLDIIQKYKQKNKVINLNKPNYIFEKNNSHLKYITFLKRLKLYKKIDLHFHIFRHTHASLLIEKGVPVEAVSRRLGHSDTKITQKIYIHLTDKLKEKEDNIFRNIKIV